MSFGEALAFAPGMVRASVASQHFRWRWKKRGSDLVALSFHKYGSVTLSIEKLT